MRNCGFLALRLPDCLGPKRGRHSPPNRADDLLPLTPAPALEAIGKGMMLWIGTRIGGFVKILDCHNLVLSDRSRNLHSHLY